MTLQTRLRKALLEAPDGPIKPIQLAADAKVTRSAVSLVLNGTTKTLKSENATKIARVLGVNVDWLIDGRQPMRNPDATTSSGSSKKPANKDNPDWARLTNGQLELKQAVLRWGGFLSAEQCHHFAEIIKAAAVGGGKSAKDGPRSVSKAD